MKAKIRLKPVAYMTNSGTGYGNSGADGTKNSLAQWNAVSGSADSDIVYNLEILRHRARDLYMSSGFANGAIKSMVTNIIGSGLKLNARVDFEFLGISRNEALKLEKHIEREFNLWADNKYCCDSAASQSFYELQSIVMTSVLLSGDVFISLPSYERKNSIYDLKIKLLEGDRVCDPMGKDLTKNILGGIEINKTTGMPEYYYIANQVPYMVNYAQIKRLEWAKVPAFGDKTGRRNILHLFIAERPEQRRGMPIFAPVIEMFKQLTRYSEAEITAAVVSSMFSVFIKTESPGTIGEDHEDDTDSDGQQAGYPNVKLSPGMVMELNPNESIETVNPGRPNTAFDGFVLSILRQIGAGLELPYEILVKHFTASYSASRAAILMAWQVFEKRREWIIRDFCIPVYQEWLTEAVAKSRVNMPGFFNDQSTRAAWCRADFFGGSIPQIDPIKEANAAKIRVEEGFSTRARETSQLTGLNYDEVAQVRVAEENVRDGFRRTEKPVYVGTTESSNGGKK